MYNYFDNTMSQDLKSIFAQIKQLKYQNCLKYLDKMIW